jgi:hypothetical protein
MNTKLKRVIKIYLLLTLLVQLGFMGQAIWRLGFDRFLYLVNAQTVHVLIPTIFSVSLLITLALFFGFIIMMPGGLFLVHYFQDSDKKDGKHKADIDSLRKKSDFKI